MKKISLILISMAIFTSCQSKLTNEEAKKLVVENLTFECSNKLKLQTNTTNDPSSEFRRLRSLFKSLESKGVLKTIEKKEQRKTNPFHSYVYEEVKVELNNELKKHKIKDNYYNVSEIKNIKITGINQEEKKATVKFTYDISPNLLYDLTNGYNGKKRNDCFKKNSRNKNGVAVISEYYTGWGVDNIRE